jgi:hypothetical protein
MRRNTLLFAIRLLVALNFLPAIFLSSQVSGSPLRSSQPCRMRYTEWFRSLYFGSDQGLLKLY